ncbi:MAG: hypothetical protein IKV13_01670, partial [Akkermansia sp.]|nr:hypothetical protein [Akkermansia sp.]
MDTNFDKQVLESYTKHVNMGSCSTVYLNAVAIDGGKSEVDDRGYSTTKWMGTVTGEGLETVSFVGLKTGLNTWADLSGLKDTQKWYAYGTDKVIQKTEDLFFTENLVFSSASAENSIVLKDTVDLGVGYAEFCTGGEGSVSYTISSEKAANGISEGNLLNSAGFVVNSGVSLHLQLTNTAEYMREWRKIGAGDLYIEGSGNNDILLNVGGAGKTYLNREGGYAAYNVLVNNGSTIIIKDVDQIKRDLTFGNRGGTLNMNGLSMDWYATAEAADENRTGFSINALTEAALIANDKGNSTLTYKETKDSTYVGSFADTATASLKIVHDSDATWTLNSIYTNLQHQDSGLLVNRGTVVLEGTNTVHGTGSATGESSERYFNEDDWHYADARMNVAVNGGTFELGSHARLTGDVTVAENGTFVMREGVRHQMEYVEGGQMLENTSKYSAYFGHKGTVQLNGGTFAVQFNEGVDSTLEYAANVTGQGSMTVDTGAVGGTLNFSGTVDAGVSKTLERGQLVLTGAAAADTSNKWLVKTGCVMVQLDNVSDTLAVIDRDSSGIIGLKGGVCTEQFDFSATHSQLGIGALAGETVQYGAEGTTETLRDWNLGGGGRLEVNYVLSGDSTLNVDADGMSGGEVSLQQVAGYSGTVNVQSAGGKMTLFTAQNGALNAATVNLNEGGVWKLEEGQSSGGTVNINNGGVLDTGAISGGTVNVNAGGLIQGADVALTGGFVELRGNMAYDTFTVSNGATLNLREGGRLDADNAATIAQGGIMRLNLQTLQDKVELKNGGKVNGSGSQISAGAEILATQGTGVIDAGTGVKVYGQIGAEKDATLQLSGNLVELYASSVNTSGGTLDVQCSTLSLERVDRIGGTLSIGTDVELNTSLYNAQQSAAHVNHTIDALDIRDGYQLKINQTSTSNVHVWNIASLTGTGELYWIAAPYTYGAGASRMILSGGNSFEGKIRLMQRCPNASWGWAQGASFLQHLELAHDEAASGAVISLEAAPEGGDLAAYNRPALAINTQNAQIRGIEGWENSKIFAGPAPTNRTLNTDNLSSALNTLTITGSGEYRYAGQIQGTEQFGLNIVMNGTGKQIFSNQWSTVHDITALQGALVFEAAPANLHGDVSIAQGAELTIGSGAYTLNSGHTLSVLAGASGEQAVLNNALVLNGGSLYFEAYGNSAGDAALSISGVSGTGATTVSFGNAGAIEWGISQWVASGNWSSVESLLTVHAPEYMNATLSAGTQGLSAVFSMKDGFYRWGDTGSLPDAGDKVVFIGDGGANIETPLNLGTGYFDSATTYTVSGGALTLDTMVKSNRGDLVLNAAVAADTLIVKEAATITGNGSLSTETLTVEADMITGLSVQAADIQGNKHTWTLDGSENRFTQQATVSQINSFSQVSVTGQAELELATDVDATLNIAINGDGSFSKGGAGKLTTTEEVKIGTLNVDAGAYEAQGGVDIDTLSAAARAEVTMYNSTADAGAEKHLGTIELGTGAVFQTNDREKVTNATTIGCVLLGGTSATLQDVYHAGYIAIRSLSLAEGVTGATLTLKKNAQSTYTTLFELGADGVDAGNFSGKIVLDEVAAWSANDEASTSKSSKRSAAIILSNGDVAKNAVISIADAQSRTAYVGLGV